MATMQYNIATFFLLLLFLSASKASRQLQSLVPTPALLLPYHTSRQLQSLVPTPALLLPYHNGPLLSGSRNIPVYLLWYGSFSASQKSIVTDFFESFQGASPYPSVNSWWKTTSEYTDKSKSSVSGSVTVGGHAYDEDASLGKNLKRTDIPSLVLKAVSSKLIPENPRAIYFVLTAEDVYVDKFCMSSCGFHDHVASGSLSLLYGWVGNPAKQCPGQCAWPFAVPQFGPPSPALVSPNRDVGMDGMVISIASLMAGTATNPMGNGYFQGDPSVPNEAVSACTGIFGRDAYPGYPGKLFEDEKTGGSFNAHGVNSRSYLLPAMWSPASKSCVTLT